MDAEQRFLQFQQTREPAHLGAVFDLVADELFAFALHLCRDQAAAEDLVQATFLVALERAHRWDARRPLRPWLLGILQREARAMRRRSRRTPDPARLPAPVEPPPVQIALSAEVSAAVAAGIASVPQPYRTVLELRLVDALENGEIAARLRRSPGAVRTQLWRGLELLRKLLPRGLAVALAAQLGMRPALAAVRQRVLVAAARPPAAVAGLGLLTGALLMQKVLIGAAAAAVLVAGWWAWSDGAGSAAAVPAPAAQSSSVMAALPVSEPPPPPIARTLIGGSEPVTAAPSTAAIATPVPVRVLVVDGKGDPVADAGVSVFEPLVKKDKTGEPLPARARMAGPPSWRGLTDIGGRVEFSIDHECFVEARKDGVGMTGEYRVFPGMQQLEGEWRLVLHPVLHIRGFVLLPDGSRAAGATVNCYHTSSQYPGLAGHMAPVTADEQGTFCLEVLPDLDYRLSAKLGKYGAGAYVDTSRGKDEYEVTLRCPGAYSVRGVLFGSDGQPTAGEVRLLTGPGDLGYRDDYQGAKTDGQGRFEILLTEGGSFELVGGVEGQTAANVRIVLDDVHPHQEAVLRLSPFLVLAGRVVDERGEPCAGVFLGCSPVTERNWLEQCRSALQGGYPRGSSAADGSFRFLVPAGSAYRLGYRPMPHLYTRGPQVMPPIENAVLVVHESDKQGFEVEGRVVSAASGATVDAFRVYLVTYEKSGGMGDQPIAEGKDGTFLAGPLMVGQRYSLRIEAEGFPPATVGPFDATVRREQVTVRLSAFGELVCTVLRPDGTPAVQAHVGLEHADGYHPFERSHQGETDRDGCIRLMNVPPADFTVYARAAAASGGSAQGTVTVRPGQQATVQLTLKQ